ncbi:hypothetical protein A7982_13670 [Minicystis rosea]|nr:hypothetical protein A7982_13670 [Minicystis rosea]
MAKNTESSSTATVGSNRISAFVASDTGALAERRTSALFQSPSSVEMKGESEIERNKLFYRRRAPSPEPG